jgi:hyperosmotically inducible protein
MPLLRHAPSHLIALAVALGVAACGQEETPKPATKPAASAPPDAPAPAAATKSTEAGTPAPATQPAPPAASAPDPDKALAKKVKSALETTQGLPAQQIDVTAKGGAVTLWGTVGDPAEQARAVEAAKAVPGVKAVENKLAIVKGS